MKTPAPHARPLPGYAAADFFVLRTPLLPISVLSDVEAAAEAADSSAAVSALVGALVGRRDVGEGLYLASPSLSDALASWMTGSNDPRAHGAVEGALKYVLRMGARCTPFGLFSGCTTGGVGDVTRLELEPRERYGRHTRLDMGYLFALVTKLMSEEAIRARVCFRPNSTLYRSDANFRYAESRLRDGGRREGCVVEIEATAGVTAGIEVARRGATVDAIVEAVASAEGATLEDAREFVDAMIDNQVLVSELEPAVTGEEPVRGLLRTLERLAPEHPVTRALAAVDAELAAFDRAGVGVSPDRYRHVTGLLAPLPEGADPSRLFHADLYKPAAKVTLGARVIRDVLVAVDVLQRIVPAGKHPDLVRFIEAFQARWETAEVPLALALDEERGIGFGGGFLTSEATPLLDGIAFPSQAPSFFRFGAREMWLSHRVSTFSAATAPRWELTDADVATLATPDPLPLPEAFSAMFALVRPLDEERHGEPTVVFEGISGPSGANLMGRFCHGAPALRDSVRRHVAQEEALAPDVVFAEIVHLPAGRIGNILARPLLRRFEIPYLARSGAADDGTLTLDDLVVTVRGSRVVLLSRRLGKEVRPRLTTAHNHAATELPIYRFLCALGRETYRSGLGWDWGPCASSAFLPRVTYRGVVLSPAMWNVSRAQLHELADAPSRMSAMSALASRLHLPRWVCLVEGDNLLPLDLKNRACVDVLAALSRNRDVALSELLSGPGDCVVSSDEGTFAAELIVPFVRTGEVDAPAAPARRSTGPRCFSPGSEWAYAKLYCGSATVDLVLQHLEPALRTWVADGDVDRWFFVRYGDPDWHLRLRVHGRPERLHARVLGPLLAAGEGLVQRGLVWRVQLDTYIRETERYGGDAAVDVAEEIFWADSEFVIDSLRLLSRDDESERLRWLWALRGCDHLLDAFGMALETKHAVTTRTAKGFARELAADLGVERAFGRLFRQERKTIEQVLSGELGARGEGLVAALDVRRARIAPLARKLGELDGAGRLVQPLPAIVDSVVHMFFNRMLKAEHRRQESVLHDLLSRAYESRLARARRAAEKGAVRG